MTYLRVFLSIQSNVSLFIQWITRSFTKAFSWSITRLNEPDSAQNYAASPVGNSAIFPDELLTQVAFSATLQFLLDLPAFAKRSESRRLSAFPRQINYSLFILLMESALGLCQNSKRVRHAIRTGQKIRRNRRLAHVGKRLACLGGKKK